MFNLFKKKDKNPISDAFKDFSPNQKLSFINLLVTIGICDGENGKGNAQKEIECLNTYLQILGISFDKSNDYFKTFGHGRMIDDLVQLSKSQKEYLVVAAWDMIICDGKPNETEFDVVETIFEKIGVSSEDFFQTVEKTQAVTKHFFKQ